MDREKTTEEKIERHLKMLVILKLLERKELIGSYLFTKKQVDGKRHEIAKEYIDNIDNNELK